STEVFLAFVMCFPSGTRRANKVLALVNSEPRLMTPGERPSSRYLNQSTRTGKPPRDPELSNKSCTLMILQVQDVLLQKYGLQSATCSQASWISGVARSEHPNDF